MLNNYVLRLKSEFKGYNSQKLVKDILAGLTVAAVALPLALAFGVSSGADAGAGLITAIVAGLLIRCLLSDFRPYRGYVSHSYWLIYYLWFTGCICG